MSTPEQIESNRVDSTKSSGPCKAEQFRTFGEILPSFCFEAVIDPQKPQSIQLHASDGTCFWTSSEIERGERIYVPATIDYGLTQVVRFPTPSVEFESPAKLIGSITDCFCNFGKTPKEDSDLLAAWALSTWFVDCFRAAPVLHVTGSVVRMHLIMRLLDCICRRPILLGRLDLSALSTLPKGLGATLLIHDEKLSKNVAHALNASRNRDLSVPIGRNLIHAYGAKVLFSNPTSVSESDLRIHLSSTAGVLPDLSDDAERTMAAEFQGKLLRYRMVNFDAVRDSNFEFAEVDPAMQDDARSLLTPLTDCGDLRASILSSLLSRSKEVAGARLTDLDCLVVEAALCFCHDPSKDAFFVQELADVVNTILLGRHEERTTTSKAVGQALRGLGLAAERVTKGFRIDLTKSNREKIHQLAGEHDVPSIKDGIQRCDHCHRRDDSVSELRTGI